jgi:hypothetical protein
VECLASCGTAPAIQVNEDYYENLNETTALNLIDEFNLKLAQGNTLIGRSSTKELGL